MSKMSIEGAMQRIKGAPPDSPIMVMKTDENRIVDAVFASTVRSKQMLDAGDDRIVGVFDGTMDTRIVAEAIEAAATLTDALRV